MTECNDPVKGIKDYEGVNGFIAVELCEIFDLGNSPLVDFEVILFQTQSNLFKKIVDDCYFEIMVEFPLLRDEVGKEVDVTKFNLCWLGKYLFQYCNHLSDTVRAAR